MQPGEILAELKKLSNPKSIAALKKTGIGTENYWGVGLDKMRLLSRKIKKNHDLASQLRKSGVHDALLFSFIIDNPKKITKQEIKEIIKEIHHNDLLDNFCLYILVNTPYVIELIDEWKDSSKEMTKRCAYILVKYGARSNMKLADQFFEEFLLRIEREISFSKKGVKEAMLDLMVCIGNRNKYLKSKTTEVALKILETEIDDGTISRFMSDLINNLMKETKESNSKTNLK